MVVLEGLHDLVLRRHDERAVLDDGLLSGSPARSMKPNLDDALTCTSPELDRRRTSPFFAEVPQNVPAPSYT